MTVYFVDTSALIKRYIPEVGSGWVISWIEPQAGNTIMISDLSTVEIVSGLSRRQREGNITVSAFVQLRNDFLLQGVSNLQGTGKMEA